MSAIAREAGDSPENADKSHPFPRFNKSRGKHRAKGRGRRK